MSKSTQHKIRNRRLAINDSQWAAGLHIHLWVSNPLVITFHFHVLVCMLQNVVTDMRTSYDLQNNPARQDEAYCSYFTSEREVTGLAYIVPCRAVTLTEVFLLHFTCCCRGQCKVRFLRFPSFIQREFATTQITELDLFVLSVISLVNEQSVWHTIVAQ